MKKRIYLINALIVLFIFLLIMKVCKVSPLGDNVFSLSDGIHQFKPFLYDFIMKIKTHTLESYSFSNGLGNPLIFTLLYYLSSPTIFIALLFKHPDSMYLSVVLLKMIIASSTMTFYTSKKTDRTDVIIIATISYVFCTWFLIYYYYLPWLDVFMIFPLFMYGLDEIINKKFSYIYIFTLAYMIMTSFYLTFSLCVFTLIYFIIYGLFYRKVSVKEKIESFKRISIGTILSILLSFGVLYALYKFTLKSGISLEGFSNNYKTNFIYLLKSLIYGNHSFITSSTVSYTYPNIACNTLILFNLIYFFLNKNNNIRDRFYGFIVIIVSLIVIFNPYIDFILNFFHQIRGLTYRYSYIFSFLMILAYINNNKEIVKEDDNDVARKLITSLILILLLGVVMIIMNYQLLLMDYIFIYIIFVACYLVITFVHGNNRYDKMILIVLVILQSLVGVYSSSFINGIEKENVLEDKYNEKNVTYRNIANDYCEGDDRYGECYNFYLYSNKKSSSLENSMSYGNVIYMIRDMGNSTYSTSAMYINEGNDISNMLFNVKNKYYLEKIYSVNKNIKNIKMKKEYQRYNEESIIKGMTGMNIFDQYEVDGEKAFKRCWISNDKLPNKDELYYYKKNLFKREVFTVTKDCDKPLKLYSYNEDKIKEAYNYLNKNQIKYTYYSDSRLEGNINVMNNQLIFTSIPYDKDWNIYVDGKKVEGIKLLNSLIGIEVSPGKHKIKLEYKEHFILPFLVSIVTFVGLIVRLIRDKKGISNEK